MSNDLDGPKIAIGFILGSLFIMSLVIIVAFLTILSGWFISIVWAWSITPIFDIPSITISQGILLGCLVKLIIPNSSPFKFNKDDSTTKQVGECIARIADPFVVLLIAYITWRLQ